MKKKILINILFIIGFIIVVALVDLASFTIPGDDILGRVFFATGYRNIGSESIVPAIEKTKDCEKYSKIVLGDSVCNQLFNGLNQANDEYLFLGTNQAITISGQYVLARQFLENAYDAKDIYLVILPGGFASDCLSDMSYSYFVEPFGKSDCFGYLSNDTITKMNEYYGEFFTRKEVITFIDDSCINNKIYLFYNQSRAKFQENSELISEDTEFYLCDLYDMCDRQGVKLHILPSPLSDTDSNRNTFTLLKKEVDEKGLQVIFGDYFERVTFYPEGMFKDGVHFADDYMNDDCRKEIITNMINETDHMNDLFIDMTDLEGQ